MRFPVVIFSYLIVVLLLSGCNKRPKYVLSDAEMVQLMSDMEAAEVYIQDNSQVMYNDSMRDKTVEWILKKRGINKAQFDSTLSWYGKNIDIYHDLYSKVDAELAKRQGKAVGEDHTPQITSGTDLWPYSHHIQLTEISNTNSLSFSLPPEHLENGDRLNLYMRITGMQTGAALLGVDYYDGSSGYTYSNQNGEKKVEISLQTDTTKQVKRIFGYLRSKEPITQPIWIDSIALQRMPYDSTQYYKIYSQRKYSGPIKKIEVKPDTIVADEQDANLQEILSNDGGLNIEDKPKRPRTIQRANNKVLDKSRLLNDKPVKLQHSK